MARSTTMTIAISPELLKRITASATAAGVSRSSFCIGAIEAYLDGAEAEIRMFANEKVREAWIRAMQQPGVLRSMTEAMRLDLSEADRQQVLKFMESAPALGGKAKGKGRKR
jgi:predicted transcriptional regulator